MKICIIGSGNMGGAVARSLAKGPFFAPSDITCTARSEATLGRIRATVPGINVSLDNREAASGADMIILAVKPWLMEEVMGGLRDVLDLENQIVASVAAGVSFDDMTDYLSPARGVYPVLFRIIPNTAIEYGCGLTFVSSRNASDSQVETVREIFAPTGSVFLIEEEMMQQATALASCGIAFAMQYIKASAQGGVSLGFTPELSRLIVEQTVCGAARLLLESGNDPQKEINKVTTPGGMTMKGLEAMEEAGFSAAVIKGLESSLKK